MQAIQRSNSFKRLQRGSVRHKAPAAPPENVGTSRALLAGYLNKCEPVKGESKKWAKRWFVLRDSYLYYYKQQEDSKGDFREFPAGIVYVNECRPRKLEGSKLVAAAREFCIELDIMGGDAPATEPGTPRQLSTPRQMSAFQMYLSADTQTEMDQWFEKLSSINMSTMRVELARAQDGTKEAKAASMKLNADMSKVEAFTAAVSQEVASMQQKLSSAAAAATTATNLLQEVQTQNDTMVRETEEGRAVVVEAGVEVKRLQSVGFEALLDDIGKGGLQWFASEIRNKISSDQDTALRCSSKVEVLEGSTKSEQDSIPLIQAAEARTQKTLKEMDFEVTHTQDVRATVEEELATQSSITLDLEKTVAELREQHEEAFAKKNESHQTFMAIQEPLAMYRAVLAESTKLQMERDSLQDQLEDFTLSSSQRFTKHVTRKISQSIGSTSSNPSSLRSSAMHQQ